MTITEFFKDYIDRYSIFAMKDLKVYVEGTEYKGDIHMLPQYDNYIIQYNPHINVLHLICPY